MLPHAYRYAALVKINKMFHESKHGAVHGPMSRLGLRYASKLITIPWWTEWPRWKQENHNFHH